MFPSNRRFLLWGACLLGVLWGRWIWYLFTLYGKDKCSVEDGAFIDQRLRDNTYCVRGVLATCSRTTTSASDWIRGQNWPNRQWRGVTRPGAVSFAFSAWDQIQPVTSIGFLSVLGSTCAALRSLFTCGEQNTYGPSNMPWWQHWKICGQDKTDYGRHQPGVCPGHCFFHECWDFRQDGVIPLHIQLHAHILRSVLFLLQVNWYYQKDQDENEEKIFWHKIFKYMFSSTTDIIPDSGQEITGIYFKHPSLFQWINSQRSCRKKTSSKTNKTTF